MRDEPGAQTGRNGKEVFGRTLFLLKSPVLQQSDPLFLLKFSAINCKQQQTQRACGSLNWKSRKGSGFHSQMLPVEGQQIWTMRGSLVGHQRETSQRGPGE